MAMVDGESRYGMGFEKEGAVLRQCGAQDVRHEIRLEFSLLLPLSSAIS